LSARRTKKLDYNPKLTSQRESPEVTDVDQPDEQCQASHLPALEQQAVTDKLKLHLLQKRQGTLLVARAEQLGATLGSVMLGCKGLEICEGDTALALVDLCHVLKNLNGLRILTAVDKEFRRLLEVEDDESQEEDEQRDATKREHQVSPSHVVFLAAAWLTGIDDIARFQYKAILVCDGEVGVARVLRDEAVCNSAANRDTDGLEDREEREHETLVLRDELEADGRVNRDIAPNAESIEGSNNKEGTIRAAASKTEAECSADKTGEVECPSTSCKFVRSDHDNFNASLGSDARVPTDDVHEESPHESASSETGRESNLVCGLEVCCPRDSWNGGANRNVTTLIACVDTGQLWALIAQQLGDIPGKPSSCCNGPRIRPKACAQIRSIKYPSPHKLQMYHWYLPKPLLSISRLIKTHFFSYSVRPSSSSRATLGRRSPAWLLSYSGGVGVRASEESLSLFLNGEKPMVIVCVGGCAKA
jgi:hypothetical protein